MTAIASKSAADRKGGIPEARGTPAIAALRASYAVDSDHRRKNRTICPAFGRSDWITALPLKEEIRRRKQPGTPGQFWTPIADQSWKPIDTALETARSALCAWWTLRRRRMNTRYL